MLRTLYRSANRSRLHRLLSLPRLERLRLRLLTTTPEDVGAVVAAVESVTEVWLAGGWGVDALLGRVTRPHKDIDLVVPQNVDVAAASVALARRGFSHSREEGVPGALMPRRVLYRDAAGRTIDLHPVELAGQPFGLLAAEGRHSRGRLAGGDLPCLPVEIQYALKRHLHGPDDGHDLEQLREHAELVMPDPVASPVQTAANSLPTS
jgi:lincosamide nucleotidyltransferase A/C/D/E